MDKDRDKERRLELNRKQREYRRRTKNSGSRRYEKTRKGFLVRAYRNMLSRVIGVQHLNTLTPLGQPLLPKDAFYEWSLGHQDFNTLFDNWERNKFDRQLSPTMNRIDPRFGYELWNMQWITGSEASIRRAAFFNHNRII